MALNSNVKIDALRLFCMAMLGLSYILLILFTFIISIPLANMVILAVGTAIGTAGFVQGEVLRKRTKALRALVELLGEENDPAEERALPHPDTL